MHSQLSVIVAQSHQYDLQRTARRWKVVDQEQRLSRRFTVTSPFKAILNGRRLSTSMAQRPAASH